MLVRRSSKWFKAGLGAFAALCLTACSGNAEEGAAVPGSGEEQADKDGPAIPVMGPERRVIAFGDSLFAGFGLEDRASDSYPAKLEAALRAQGVNATMIDAGVSGDTTAGGRQRLAFLLDQQEEKPDLFILELGGNDILRAIKPDETRANLAAMLEELKKREIPVLLMGMRAPVNYGPEFEAQFNPIYEDLADQYGAKLIPFWVEPLVGQTNLLQSDGVHPTEEGIEKLVEATLDQVKAALPEVEEAA